MLYAVVEGIMKDAGVDTDNIQMHSGHMADSANIPYETLVENEKTMPDAAKLKERKFTVWFSKICDFVNSIRIKICSTYEN